MCCSIPLSIMLNILKRIDSISYNTTKVELIIPMFPVVGRGCSRAVEEGGQEGASQEGGALQVLRAEHLQGRHRAGADVPLP